MKGKFSMTKEDIIQQLQTLNIDLNEIILINDTALVFQDIIEKTAVIELSCSNEFFNTLAWNYKIGYSGLDTKFEDNIEIINNFYNPKNSLKIANFNVASLEDTYNFKKFINTKKDKKVLEKIEYLLCEKNNFYWYEQNLRNQGLTYIAGVDEVGRGPLVGPVVAACVVLPKNFSLAGLTDSKKLSESKRNYFFDEIKKQALGIGLGIIDEKKIDEINIYEATKLAMQQAIAECQQKCPIEHILIDAMPLDLKIKTTSIIKGDVKSITISAASVIAKVTRDRLLYDLDKKYPMYDFKDNKGYPTKKHLEAIAKYGIIDEHRRSYGPVKEYIDKKEVLSNETSNIL